MSEITTLIGDTEWPTDARPMVTVWSHCNREAVTLQLLLGFGFRELCY